MKIGLGIGITSPAALRGGTGAAPPEPESVLQTYSVWTLLGPVSVVEDSARVVAVVGTSLTMETT